jgi:hypothetical protein
MAEERTLTLHEIADARGALGKEIEVLKMQLVRLPSRAFLYRTLLIATAPIWALLSVMLLLR